MLNRYFNKKRISRGVEIEDSIMTATAHEEAIIETPFKRSELSLVWYFILIFIFILTSRVFYLDFIKGDYYYGISKGNRVRSIIVKSPRGKIFDKFGNTLVGNIPSMDAVIIPNALSQDPQKLAEMKEMISKVLDMEKGNVELFIDSQNKKSLDPVLLKENITQEQALILMEKERDFPGISIDNTAIRQYESSMIFSSVIGYDGKITKDELDKNPSYLRTDYIGKAGLEKSYEKELRGIHGAKQVEVDSRGNIKKNLGILNPQPGNDLILNIDEGLQKKIYDSLAAILEKTGTRTASAVAIDPRNGGVLAMVSLPSYDNNLFARGISNDEYKAIISDKELPLLNRTISGEYPPGSTLKPAVAAAALSEGIITPETTVNDATGAINIGKFRFGDWKTHGVVDVKKAIAESCDVFFYAIGGGYGNIQGLGMNVMQKYEKLFGFGDVTGIDLPGELPGLIPNEEWKLKKIKERWYVGDSYHASIGQGFITATPLQLANYTASIANGGTLYAPRVVNKIRKSDGKEEFIAPNITNEDFISADIMKVLREGMKQTVTDGTAQPLKTLLVEVAGKTGTAEFGGEGKTHAWFISFAPYENPEIAMAVLVEGGGDGHSSAVPVSKDVYEWYFSR